MEFRNIGAILVRYWWLIVIAVVICTGSTVYLTAGNAPVYRSATTVVIGPSENFVAVDNITRTLDALGRRSVIATYSAIAASQKVKDAVADELGLSSAAKQYAI